MQLSSLDRASSVFAGVVDGLCDPDRRRRVALALVCGYAAAWTVYGVIAKSSQDINADMAEMVVWGRAPALGYPKHPPLLAYLVRLWFAIFPQADWAFTLLAALTLSAGIYLAFELCGVWLDGAKRAAVPFLLAVIPFYNFLGLKFDQNAALIPLWALAMLALMRSLETRRTSWAVVLGLSAAAAMLVKYWSIFLLVALALAILFDRRRGTFLRSPAPWISAAVFLALTVPHLIWLIENHFPPLNWIGTRRTADTAFDFVRSLSEYSFGTIGYAAPAIVLVALLIHPSGKAVRDSWFVWQPERRPAMLLFWTPLLLPIAVALPRQANLLSLWNAPALNLLPVMMLASPLVTVSRLAVRRLAAIVTAITLIAVLSSPLVALAVFKQGVENEAGYARLAAAAIESQWHDTTKAPLRLVAGPFALASAATFYMSERPSTFADFSRYLSPWATPERLAPDGFAIICPADLSWCVSQMNGIVAEAQTAKRGEVTLTPRWLGVAGEPRRFVIATIPPRP
jgi:4-amino-4-deoxy-L-arabinose transferase-like glycosyltransferase